jgi:hypothetical protein
VFDSTGVLVLLAFSLGRNLVSEGLERLFSFFRTGIEGFRSGPGDPASSPMQDSIFEDPADTGHERIAIRTLEIHDAEPLRPDLLTYIYGATWTNRAQHIVVRYEKGKAKKAN